MVLHALGLGPGDEVVVPSLSFIASANAPRYVGATPPQVEGLIADVHAVLAGEPLGPMVMPEETNAVTSRDRKPRGQN